MYLGSHLPPWWYKVWGSVTTVPLFKTVERETVRPVGVRNPLIRTLHSRVIRENRATLNAFLEPEQLALSQAGGHKLVHQVRQAMEEHRDWVVAKVDVRNAHNEIWRNAIITALEAEPTLQHLAWFAAVVLAPSTGLETGGTRWGEQGEGETQGDPKASAFFAGAIHGPVRRFDAELSRGGGFARFGNDDGYGCGPANVVFPALARLEVALREECGLTLQRQKTEVFSWGELPPGTPGELRRAGSVVAGEFEPGFDCYGIPLGSDAYVGQALWEKGLQVKRDMEQVAATLSQDSQALWVALHRSLAHKLDYLLSLCYPSDILPVAQFLDTVAWSVFERAVGQHVPRQEEGLGTECVLGVPVDTMEGCSFQETLVRLPIRLRGFGLRSFADTALTAFIGGVELALGEERVEGEVGWWRALMDTDSRTAREYSNCWDILLREGEQAATFLDVELTGALASGPAIVEQSRPGESCRQLLTMKREELKEAVLREALTRHPDKSARPVRAYPQLDKLSTAWKLSLPGVTNGLSTPVFHEVMAMALCLPSPACQPILGQPLGHQGAVVGPFADELNCAFLTGDSWRHRHDLLKIALVNMCNEARLPVDCEVFGLFRDLIPAELAGPGGELQHARQRNGLCPDFMLRLPSADGPRDSLGELKFISAGLSRYPLGSRRKAVDVRAAELPGTYRRPLQRLDAQHHGTREGETGPLVRRLQGYGLLQGYVAGAWGEGSEALHALVQTCAEARVAHLCRANGRQETEHMLGQVVGQYRRLISTCTVRAAALCTLARVGEITPAAKAAAGRRQVTMRLEQEMRAERKAQWMAGMTGPGWARGGRCHSLL